MCNGAPDARRIASVETAHPGTQVWWECATGETLADFDTVGEGQGLRYAVINLGAASREALVAKVTALQDELGARLTPVL